MEIRNGARRSVRLDTGRVRGGRGGGERTRPDAEEACLLFQAQGKAAAQSSLRPPARLSSAQTDAGCSGSASFCGRGR
jgi:hypothetical protein